MIRRLFFGLFLIAIGAGGCRLSLQDGQKDLFPVSLSGQSCLDHALPVIERFYEGAAESAEVDRAWQCTADTLSVFTTFVRGQTPGVYRATELRDFVETYFLKSRKISDALMVEGMHLKQALVGGTDDVLTIKEIERLKYLIGILRVVGQKLLPYMKMLSLSASPDAYLDKGEFVEQGIAQAVASARLLGDALSEAGAPYRIENVERFLREFGALYAGTSDWQGPERLVKYLPAFAALKAFFLRPSGLTIAAGEWRELVPLAGRLYGLYLRYYYLLQDQDKTAGVGLTHLDRWGGELFSLLDDALAAKDASVIAFAQVDDLATQLQIHDVFAWPVSAATLRSLAHTIIEHPCHPASGSHRASINGLDATCVAWLRRSFAEWVGLQQRWDQMAGGTPSLPLSELRARWKLTGGALTESDGEMDLLLRQERPLVFTPIGTVILQNRFASSAPVEVNVDQFSWTSLNWKRFFISTALRGYISNFPSDMALGLRKSEFKNFYEDMRAFGTEIKFLDPRDPNIWDSSFDEANIFLPSANGDDRISYVEGVETLSFALSGAQMSRRAYRDVRENCENLKDDVFGLPMVPVECFRRRMRANFPRYFSGLTGWVREEAALSGKDRLEMHKYLEIAARRAGYRDVPAESADIDKASMLLQYIEALFVRFDIDGSGTLSLEESQAIFPLLRTVLARLSGLSDDADLWAVFTYAVRYGEAPDHSLWTKIKFIWWRSRPESWSYEASRADILKVVANLTHH